MKVPPRLQNEVVDEGVNLFREWRQKIKNGILPIGTAYVGKSTLLSRFNVAGPNLFMDFNRTLATKVDELKLRREFIERCSGVEYVKPIDVPGELPEEWAKAYFDNNPRILAILVDDRPAADHIQIIREFVTHIEKGPSYWQKVKTLAAFRWNNLTRILFVVNKSDQIDRDRLNGVYLEYKGLLADIKSSFGADIQVFNVSLTTNTDEELKHFFDAILDGLARK